MYYVFMQMLSSGPAWLSIILLITAGLLPDVLKKVIWRALWPTTTERIQVSAPVHPHTTCRTHADPNLHVRRQKLQQHSIARSTLRPFAGGCRGQASLRGTLSCTHHATVIFTPAAFLRGFLFNVGNLKSFEKPNVSWKSWWV